MTSVADFKKGVLEVLQYLDSGILPSGSHILFQGVRASNPFQMLQKIRRIYRVRADERE